MLILLVETDSRKTDQEKYSYFWAEPLAADVERNRKYKRAKVVSIWRKIDRHLRRQRSANLNSTNPSILLRKYYGYKIHDPPECLAIMVATTSIRMQEGSDRGIKAHKVFIELPEVFVILFSKLRVTTSRHFKDLQACYQVALSGDRVHIRKRCFLMVMHMWSTTRFAVVLKEKRMLKWRTKLNMALANCMLEISQRPVSDKNCKDLPTYLQITKPVPNSHEVLYHYGAGHRLNWSHLVYMCFFFY